MSVNSSVRGTRFDGRQVLIGAKQIGSGRPCFLIAEAGVNHNGDPALAHELVAAAADAGADAVKFQTFVPEGVATPSAPKADYQVDATQEQSTQLQMLRKLALPTSALDALREDAESRGIVFLSTPFDSDSVDVLKRVGVKAFKVSSGDLTNTPFLRKLAAQGTPLLVSTGMATLDEVAAAVLTIRTASDVPIALFHCVTSYPARPEDCNLSAMATLRTEFRVPVGWSDHTEGIDISIAAVALGAEMLEKHLTLDRRLPGPDQKASLEPDELAAMIKAVRRTESAIGTGEKVPTPTEAPLADLARRSLFTARDIQVGDLLEEADVVVLRPGTGLPPTALDALVGRRTRQRLPKGTLLRHDYFE